MSVHKKTYALSVGPIISVINQGKTTREVWGASYFYSYLVKSVVTYLSSREGSEVLSPLMAEMPIPKGAGVYPDLIIWTSPHTHEEENVELAKRIKAFKFGPPKKFELLRIPLVQLDDADAFNYFTTSSTAMAQLESADVIPEVANFWFDGLASDRNQVVGKTSTWINDMLNDVFGAETKRRLRSLIEVSAVALEPTYTATDAFALHLPHTKPDSLWSLVNSAKDNENLADVLAKAHSSEWLMRHKYLAVVQGDGDRIGKGLIAPFGHDDEKVKAISTALSKYSAEAAQLIAQYGGQPIYTGGDDLFFFAPLTCHPKAQHLGLKSLPDLLQLLSDKFQAEIQRLASDWKRSEKEEGSEPIEHTGFTDASTSFGVHIMHYKQPLDRAISSAQALLFSTAKSTSKADRPAVAMRLEMHSSAPSDIALWKMQHDEDSLWHQFKELVNSTLLTEDAADDGVIFSSLQHKLATYLEEIVTVAAAGYSMQPFYDRLIRFQDDSQTFKNISKPLNSLVQYGALDCLESQTENDTAMDTSEEKVVVTKGTKIDFDKVDQLKANLQLALKFAHLLQRKDIDYE